MREEEHFALIVLGIYADYKKMHRLDVYNLFESKDVIDWLISQYDYLHLVGKEVIVEEIDKYLETKENT